MRVPSSGRQGAKAHAPQSAVLQDMLANPAEQPVRAEMAAFCASLSPPVTLNWATFDEDEVRGLTVDLVKEMGVPAPQAARIIAKLRGWQAA